MHRWPDPVHTSFGLLGPLDVRRGGLPVAVPGAMPRAVLTLLLLSRGEVVSTDRLAEALWGERQPASATPSLRNHVLRVRQFLGGEEPGPVQTRAGGYLVQVAPGQLDLDVFAELCDSGRGALRDQRWEQAVADLTDALALWRGEPLSDLPASAAVARREQLREARLLAFEGRTEARLRLGRHRETITDLRALTAEHPFREAFHGQLMLALYRSGRQAEALEVFRTLRQTLVEDLALEPSGELRELHQRILAGDPLLHGPVARAAVEAGAGPAARTEAPRETEDETETKAETQPETESPPHPAPSPTPAPAHLPSAVGDFAGRDKEIEVLTGAILGAGHRPPSVPIAVVTGGGGLGKTTLIVRVAHRLAELFPDGRLFVDLHGMDPAPRDPGDVLGQWLRDLGVAAADVPEDAEARAARFRSLTHGRRFLLVLDNARDVGQISLLLPAAPGCAVLVTSRDRLAALPGCVRLELEPLPDSEALTLLEQIVGTDRIRAEPQATADILAACGGLPLALRIAGSRLNARRTWSVRTLAARLADQRHRLTELRIGDLAARASFQVSYQALPDGPDGTPARLFRLLGLVTGPDIDSWAAAALVGTTVAEVEDALEVLVDAHLLECAVPGRYRAHDLLRDFSRELAREEHTEPERRAAVARLLAWYIHTTAAAAGVVVPGAAHWGLSEIAAAGPVRPLPDAQACWEWLLAEREALSAAVTLAEAALPGPHAWVLAAELMHFYKRRGLWSDLHQTHTVGLRCATRRGDAVGRSCMLSGVFYILHSRALHEESLSAAHEAMLAAEQAAEPRLMAAGWANYATSLGNVGRIEEAMQWHRRSISAMREIGTPETLAATLLNFGVELSRVGRFQEADDTFAEALEVARGSGSLFMRAHILYAQALSRRDQGAVEETIALLIETNAVHGQVGNQAGQANAQVHLGEAYLSAGRPEDARAAWTRAVALFDELGDSQAGQIRRRLRELAADAPTLRPGSGRE